MTDNHTIQISFPTHDLWISLLTSHVKDNIEYRLTFSDGVVRYATHEEISQHSELSFIAPYILDLEPIEESRLGLYNGHLYVNSQIRKPSLTFSL